MYFDAGIIILDEPTTALSLKEVDKVLTFVGGIHLRNKACVYISHNMGHVYRVAHRIVMLDRGRIVGEYAKTSLSLEELGAKLIQIQAVTEGQTP
jgi:simple sugar transport system ATP-binding protein